MQVSCVFASVDLTVDDAIDLRTSYGSLCDERYRLAADAAERERLIASFLAYLC